MGVITIKVSRLEDGRTALHVIGSDDQGIAYFTGDWQPAPSIDGRASAIPATLITECEVAVVVQGIGAKS